MRLPSKPHHAQPPQPTCLARLSQIQITPLSKKTPIARKRLRAEIHTDRGGGNEGTPGGAPGGGGDDGGGEGGLGGGLGGDGGAKGG